MTVLITDSFEGRMIRKAAGTAIKRKTGIWWDAGFVIWLTVAISARESPGPSRSRRNCARA